MSERPRFSLEELLLRHGAITSEQLDKAHAVQRKTGKELAQVLVELRFIDEQRLHEITAPHLAPPVEQPIPKTLEEVAARLVALEQTVRPLREELATAMSRHPQFAAIHARLERLEQLAHNEVNAVKALTEMLIEKGVIDREQFFIRISHH